MKIIHVTGDDDYSALQFEEYFEGKTVDSIIERIEAGEDFDGDWIADVLEFADVDPAFIKFVVQEIQDYDDAKHVNFYVQGDTV